MFKAFPDEVSEKLDVSFNGIFEQGATALAKLCVRKLPTCPRCEPFDEIWTFDVIQ